MGRNYLLTHEALSLIFELKTHISMQMWMRVRARLCWLHGNVTNATIFVHLWEHRPSRPCILVNLDLFPVLLNVRERDP